MGNAKALSNNWRFVVAGMIAVFAAYCGYAGKPGKAFLAKWEAAGYPTTLEEWNRSYPEVSEEENAALVYQQAYDASIDYLRLDSSLLDDESYPAGKHIPTGPPKLIELLCGKNAEAPGLRAAVAQFLDDNADAITLFHKASRMPKCRLATDVTKWPMVDSYNQCRAVREGSQVLALEALYHAVSRELEKAAEAIIAELGMIRALEREPTLTSQFVRGRICETAHDSIERVLCRTSFSSRDLTRMQQACSTAFRPGQLVPAAMIESYFSIGRQERWILDYLHHDHSPWFWSAGWARSRATYWTGEGDLPRIFMQHILSLRIDADRGHSPLLTHRRIDQKYRDIEERLIHVFPMPQFSIWMPSMSIWAQSQELRSIAYMRNAEAAFAVERYRLENGDLPDGLADLVPEFLERVLADPFVNRPLSYRRIEYGYVVYSFGEDLDDDNGEELDYPDRDLPLRVQPPALSRSREVVEQDNGSKCP